MIHSSPAHHGHNRKRGVSLDDYQHWRHTSIPVAIPSFRREQQLCEQTLSTLRRYLWDMSTIHIFVDPVKRRADGSSEYDNYYHHLHQNGFHQVQVHPGGTGLSAQYNRIFEFFGHGKQVVLMSDMVPSFLWKRKASLQLEEFPEEKFIPLVRLAFDLCDEVQVRAWSLGPCKSVRNMIPGRISRKNGLLDGNCFGVTINKDSPLTLNGSDYTTDVEFSLKAWTLDGGAVRFLGISAQHEYRSLGGQASVGLQSAASREADTHYSISQLSEAYPRLIKYWPKKRMTDRSMPYKFLPKGPAPLMLFGSYSLRGRRAQHGRPRTTRERVAKHRRLALGFSGR